MAGLTLKRLRADDPTSWGYWPILEARVRAQIPVLEPEAPPDAVIRHFRSLWVTQEKRVGAWLALQAVEQTNGHVPLPLIVAHMLGYIDMYWGQPCLFIYQLEGDPGLGALDLLVPMMRELDAWRGEVNRTYLEAGSDVRVDLVRFYTTRPEAYARWFRHVAEVQAGGTIVTFRLSEVSIPNIPVEG